MRTWIGIFLMLCSISLWGGKPPEPSFSLGAYNQRLIMQRPVPKGDFQHMVIPFKRVGNLIIVEATVDGIRGNFIFDTGAPYLVLNATYFRNYKEEEGHIATDVTGKLNTQRTTEVERLKVMGMYYENLEADVSDLSTIENKRGIQVLGLLGVNLFMRMEIEINLQDEQLIVYRIDREGRRLEQPSYRMEGDYHKSFELRNNAIIASGTIAGQSLNFCFDTGAEALLLDNDLDEEVYTEMRIVRRSTLNGAGGSSTEVLFGALREMEFGPKLKSCQVMIADLEEIGRAYGFPVDGFVGYDLLRMGSVCINFKTMELIVNVFKKEHE